MGSFSQITRTSIDFLVVPSRNQGAIACVLQAACDTLACQLCPRCVRTFHNLLVVANAATKARSHVCSRPHVIHLHANCAQDACELFMTSWLMQPQPRRHRMCATGPHVARMPVMSAT